MIWTVVSKFADPSYRLHLWKAQTEDGVNYTSEEKARLLALKLKKSDANIDNLVAVFLDLTKQIMNFLLSLILTVLVSP